MPLFKERETKGDNSEIAVLPVTVASSIPKQYEAKKGTIQAIGNLIGAAD